MSRLAHCLKNSLKINGRFLEQKRKRTEKEERKKA